MIDLPECIVRRNKHNHYCILFFFQTEVPWCNPECLARRLEKEKPQSTLRDGQC